MTFRRDNFGTWISPCGNVLSGAEVVRILLLRMDTIRAMALSKELESEKRDRQRRSMHKLKASAE